MLTSASRPPWPDVQGDNGAPESCEQLLAPAPELLFLLLQLSKYSNSRPTVDGLEDSSMVERRFTPKMGVFC